MENTEQMAIKILKIHFEILNQIWNLNKFSNVRETFNLNSFHQTDILPNETFVEGYFTGREKIEKKKMKNKCTVRQ